MDLYNLTVGGSPLLISIPHSGLFVPEEIKARFSALASPLPDTDWHIDRLYDFTQELGATIIKANYSRYVIDLNRPPDDATLYPGQLKVGLCPAELFNGGSIYKDGTVPDQEEINSRREKYWQPYHVEIAAHLQRIKDKHGYALLYDAHSIPSVMPRLFEGKLPDLNLGTNNGAACAPEISGIAFAAAKNSKFSSILNGRFIGGYITRHYGNPGNDIHALQMELTQLNYMDEKTLAYNEKRAAELRPVLGSVLSAFLDGAKSVYSPPHTAPTQGLMPKR